jgi:hypothetical protein
MSYKIKSYSNTNFVIKEGYIINNKIIEIYNKWFKGNALIDKLHKDNNYITLSKNFKNEYGYISETNIDQFLTGVVSNLPKEYIKEIKDINNNSFISEFFKKELYTPEIKYYNNDKNYFFFSKCRIINKKLAEYLFYNIQKTDLVKEL